MNHIKQNSMFDMAIVVICIALVLVTTIAAAGGWHWHLLVALSIQVVAMHTVLHTTKENAERRESVRVEALQRRLDQVERSAPDTDRLNFLLQFFNIDDIGDEFYVPGVIVLAEQAEEKLTFGPKDKSGRAHNFLLFGHSDRDMRCVIDMAIAAHNFNQHQPKENP